MDRRDFLKMFVKATPVACISTLIPKVKEGQKPKAILVDPYQVNLNDLKNMKIPELKGVRIVRVRRPAWGKVEPIKIIY